MQWIKLSDRMPNPDKHGRVLIYTEGYDFNGEQVFDVKAETLNECFYADPDDQPEVCKVATHWMPHPANTGAPNWTAEQKAANALRDLMDASQLLGASTWQAAFLVVLPNLRKGLMIALLLSFSFLFGEFVFANILVGTRYETLQVYLNNMRNSSGHFTSALVISYFLFVLVLTWVATFLNKDKSQ